MIDPGSSGLLVRPEVAQQHFEAEHRSAPGEPRLTIVDTAIHDAGTDNRTASVPPGVAPAPAFRPRRLHGAVALDPACGRDAGQTAEEGIAHLVAQAGAQVKVTLEIEVKLPDGATEQLVWTVTENSRVWLRG